MTTPCRAGSRRSRATASTTSGGAGGSGSTSTARSTSCSSDRGTTAPVDVGRVTARLAAVRAVAADPRAELLVAGRTSAATLAWLERHTAGRVRAWVEERGLRAALAAGDRRDGGTRRGRSGTGERARDRPRRGRARGARRPARPAVRCRDRRHAGPAGPPPRGRRGGLALSRGSLRLGPPAARAGGRSVAQGADRVRGGRADPDPAGRAHPGRSGDATGHRAAPARGVRRGRDAGPPPRSRSGPRCRRAGRGARGADPRRDRARRPDHVRPVHGAGAVRPRWRLLPGRGRAPGPRRRLPDRPGGAPDLRGRAVARGRRRLGSAGPAGSVRAPRVRRRDRHARARDPRRPRDASGRISRRRSATNRSRSSRAGSRRSRRGSTRPGTALASIDADVAGSPGRRVRPGQRGPRRPADASGRRHATAGCARSSSASRGRRASSTSRPTRRRRPWPPGSPTRASRSPTASGPRSASRSTRWVAGAAAGLGRGVLLLIDYGYPGRGALRPGPAPRRHAPRLPPAPRPRRPVPPRRAAGPDRPRRRRPPSSERRARPASTHLGTTTQAEFLVGLGTGGAPARRSRPIPATTMEDYLAVRSALVRLLDPAAMGRFRVMAFGRGWPDGPPLAGLGLSAGASAHHRPHLTAPNRTGLGRCTYCCAVRRRGTIRDGRARPDGEWRANLHARSARAAPRHLRAELPGSSPAPLPLIECP